MLDKYKNTQNIACDILINEIKNNQIGHAYLFDENNSSDAYDVVMAFVKEILCHNLRDADKEMLLQRIDDENYPEIKIIEPDGMLIKKKQILDLQQEFSMSAIEGNKRIYIIRDADKMRSETANSMLKFLEEPSNDIVAILMTNNYNGMLATIVSRCQLIRLSNNLNNGDITDLDNIAINFVKNVELSGIDSIISEKELVFDNISVKDREKMSNFFDKVIDIYYDIVKIMNKNLNVKFSNDVNLLTEIANKNTLDIVLDKINYLLEARESIKYNVNINLLIDSVIVNIGGKK